MHVLHRQACRILHAADLGALTDAISAGYQKWAGGWLSATHEIGIIAVRYMSYMYGYG